MSIAVVGIGNILLQDEGVGVHAVRYIQEHYSFSPEIEILDGGTLGLDLLPFIERFDKILFVDAVNFVKEPGYIGVLEDEEIPSLIHMKLSAHHIGLADILSLGRLKGILPKKVCLVGIQPQTNPFLFGTELSDEIKSKMLQFVDEIIKKLREWNVTCVLQSHQR